MLAKLMHPILTTNFCSRVRRSLDHIFLRFQLKSHNQQAEPGGLLTRHRRQDNAEIYVLEDSSAHPQTGSFVEGDYILESKGAVHDPLLFEHKTEFLMVSRGPFVFLAKGGSDLYLMDVPMLQGMLEAAKSG